MSLRAATASLVTGALVASLYPGHGIRGDAVPTTGTHGGSIFVNDRVLPADAAKEFRALLVTPPSGLTNFYLYEDGSFTATGPDAAYSFVYRLFVDGVDLGTATVNFSIGAAGVTLTPTAAALALQGYAPTVAQPISLLPAAATLAVQGFAPTVTQPQALQPAAAALAVQGHAPTVTQTVALVPAAASLAVQGYAPTLTQGGAVMLLPGGAVLAVQGHAPTVRQRDGDLVPSSRRVVVYPPRRRIVYAYPET